jgi:heptosyltransferase III
LAAAIGLPVLALFGPTNPAQWAPRGENITVLRCDPIDELPVERVLDSAQKLLA